MALDVGSKFEELLRGEALNEFRIAVEQRFADQVEAADRAIRRFAMLLMGSAVLFELLMTAKVESISVLGITLDDSNFLLLVVPLAGAALFAQLLRSMAAYSLYSELQRAVLTAINPKLSAHNLEWFLVAGQQSLVASAEMFERLIDARALARVFHAFLLGLYSALALTPILYGAYAYGRLFSRDGLSTIWTTVSLGASTLLVVVGVMELIGIMLIDSAPRTVPVEEADDEGS